MLFFLRLPIAEEQLSNCLSGTYRKQNYPNPFNTTTAIAIALPEQSTVRLDIYDLNGRLVRTLIDTSRPAGFHTVQWDGQNAGGQSGSSGVYFYRLYAIGLSGEKKRFIQTRRMMFLK